MNTSTKQKYTLTLKDSNGDVITIAFRSLEDLIKANKVYLDMNASSAQ